MDDLIFLQGMYNAGAAPYFDVLADHPYGYISTPEADPITSQSGLLFRRAERHHAYMVANGDGAKQIWATEMGWAINPATEGYNCPASEIQWYQIFNQQQQADYLVRAYQWAKSYWPWMGAMFTWNFDFDEAPWYAQCNSFRFFAVKNRLAKTALQSWVQNPPPTYTPVPTTPVPLPLPLSRLPLSTPRLLFQPCAITSSNFNRDGGPLSIDLDAYDLDTTRHRQREGAGHLPQLHHTATANDTRRRHSLFRHLAHATSRYPPIGQRTCHLHHAALCGRSLPSTANCLCAHPADTRSQYTLLGRADHFLGL